VTVGSFEYYPFGETKVATGCRESDQRFTGKPTDAESGLQYYGARFMANSLGRFTSVDPSTESFDSADPQSWNRYAYSLADPLNFKDTDGRLTVLYVGWVNAGENAGSRLLTSMQIFSRIPVHRHPKKLLRQ
jgi:RHS repeat-associated protein